ncbi:MAG: hypothetical protein HQK91_00865 [Nitrospirae bacterium]|nr:hypothetical protein [Nitrospirota bacterium]MBF0539989.1 hypothetical protein [Nitrospirota bacterium]
MGYKVVNMDVNKNTNTDVQSEEYTVSWTIKLKTKVKASSFNDLYRHLDKIDVQRGGKYVLGSMENLEIEGLPYSKN